MSDVAKIIKNAHETTRFPRGTRVNKVSGYRFPGVVVSAFTTTAGNVRFVVEATGADYAGMLHIFSAEQLVEA